MSDDFTPQENYYKSNSHKSKEQRDALPEKKVEKIISGNAKPQKKSIVQKFAELFAPNDISDAKSAILVGIVIPLIKKAIDDTVHTILYGGDYDRSRSTAERYPYDKNFNNRNSTRSRSRISYSYDDAIVPTRGEAEYVLDTLDDMIHRYGTVSVADLYDMVGIKSDYTDNKYGWTDVRETKIVSVRDGYLIKMPRATPLD